MDHLDTAVLEEYLRLGSAISIGKDSVPDVAATIQSIDSDQVRLSLPKPGHFPNFRIGDSVELKYWDEGSTIYRWPARIIEIDPAKENISLSVDGHDLSIQRRKSYRVRAKLPLSATVVSAADPDLPGQRLAGATTENLTIGGLLFRTEVSLTFGDKLELQIDGGELGTITAFGWVLRTGPGVENDPRYLVAVQFLQLEESDQRNLNEFLRSFY